MHHDQLSTNAERILGEKNVYYYLMLMLEIMPEGEAWTHVTSGGKRTAIGRSRVSRA